MFEMEHNVFLKNKTKEVNRFKYDLVVSCIKCYKFDTPVKNNQICKDYKLSGVELRDIVREARRKGIPIGSDPRGYYICKEKSELLHTLNHLKSRSLSMLQTISYMEKIFNETYQLDMFDTEQIFGSVNENIKLDKFRNVESKKEEIKMPELKNLTVEEYEEYMRNNDDSKKFV